MGKSANTYVHSQTKPGTISVRT